MVRSIFLSLIAILCFGCGSMTARDDTLRPAPHSAMDDHVVSLTYNRHNDGYVCNDDAPNISTEITGWEYVGRFVDDEGKDYTHVKILGPKWRHYFCTNNSQEALRTAPGAQPRLMAECCHAHRVKHATSEKPAQRKPADDVAEVGLELRPRAEPAAADVPHERINHDGYTCEGYMTAKFEIGNRMSLLNHFTDHDKLFAHMDSDGKHYFCQATQIPKTTQIETSFLNCCLTERLR